jgi:hypothetical protein
MDNEIRKEGRKSERVSDTKEIVPFVLRQTFYAAIAVC